jgi:hypothetical protein
LIQFKCIGASASKGTDCVAILPRLSLQEMPVAGDLIAASGRVALEAMKGLK